MVRHAGASAIVPLDESGQVTLIHQFRYAAGGYIWEIPAGILKPGEAPHACAARELREEVGLTAAELTPLGSVLTAPGFCDERIHLFLAPPAVAGAPGARCRRGAQRALDAAGGSAVHGAERRHRRRQDDRRADACRRPYRGDGRETMKVGIAGFPRSGKTTIFNALTGQHADVGGFGEPGKAHLGTIKVPDARVDRLTEIFPPRKTTYAEMVFVDFPAAGVERRRQRLDAATLTQMRESDALVHVVRGFAGCRTSGDAPTAVRDLTQLQERADPRRSRR